MTNLWHRNGNRVAALTPGPDDLFVVTSINGKRAWLDPITNYNAALERAQAFAEETMRSKPFTVRVLCMNAPELLSEMGLRPDEMYADQTPEQEREMRELAYNTFMEVLEQCSDQTVRAEALEGLRTLGAIQPAAVQG